ncbi:phytanoyl-CoA dioxygenase family protein [Henriciella sp. AS95]|uniref:phytanoyl-CoA dioxygenase family protein n=1 Tax=Henriciella sp. AS95 TaxID=3135782 RepID=UPI00317A7ECB
MPQMQTADLPRLIGPGELEQAASNVRNHGICLIANVLSSQQLERAHHAVYDAAEHDETRDHIDQFELDYDDKNHRIWNLLSLNSVFVELAEHPTVLHLLRAVLGWPCLLSSFSANIAYPGGDAGALHADQFFVPGVWDRPLSLNIGWAIDDFTLENGATHFVPGSHRLKRSPTSQESQSQNGIQGIVPAGSLIAFEGRLWHKTGANRSKNQARAGLFANYVTNIYRTQENMFLSVNPLVVQMASRELQVLLGYRTRGLGMVNGLPPLWHASDDKKAKQE